MENLNIYDTKQIYCVRCEKSVGEVDYDAKIINSLCGKCANPQPEGDDILYVVNHYQAKSMQKLNQPILVEL